MGNTGGRRHSGGSVVVGDYGSAPPLRGTTKDEKLKVVVVGGEKVGKTTFLMNAVGVPIEEEIPSVLYVDDEASVDVVIKEEGGNDSEITLSLWDTSGKEDFDKLRPLSYPETSIYVLMFSMVDRKSFENCKEKWKLELEMHSPGTPIVLVGTKTDLTTDEKIMEELAEKEDKPITKLEGEKLAKELRCEFFYSIQPKDQSDCKKLALNVARHYVNSQNHSCPVK